MFSSGSHKPQTNCLLDHLKKLKAGEKKALVPSAFVLSFPDPNSQWALLSPSITTPSSLPFFAQSKVRQSPSSESPQTRDSRDVPVYYDVVRTQCAAGTVVRFESLQTPLQSSDMMARFVKACECSRDRVSKSKTAQGQCQRRTE